MRRRQLAGYDVVLKAVWGHIVDSDLWRITDYKNGENLRQTIITTLLTKS